MPLSTLSTSLTHRTSFPCSIGELQRQVDVECGMILLMADQISEWIIILC